MFKNREKTIFYLLMAFSFLFFEIVFSSFLKGYLFF